MTDTATRTGERTSATEQRLHELRARGAQAPEAARSEAWEWIRELGASRAIAELDEIFEDGRLPEGLDGQTEGMLVSWCTHPAIDSVLGALTRRWLPWLGKSFDQADSSGSNLVTGSARNLGKLLWPFYEMRRAEGASGGAYRAFAFETYPEPGKLDPGTEVMVLDYGRVERNPRLAIKQIRDELVEVVRGVYLGKMLVPLPGGRRRNAAFFALKG